MSRKLIGPGRGHASGRTLGYALGAAVVLLVASAGLRPGGATEGDSKEEALEALPEAAQAYLDVMSEHGDPLPENVQQEVMVVDSADVVAITV